MRYILLIFLLLSTLLSARQDVTKQIKKSNKTLKTYNKKHSTLNKKINAIAKEIISSEKKLISQEEEIKKLNSALERSQSSYTGNQKELVELQGKQKTIQGKQELIEKELVRSIARNISINALNESDRTLTTESIMVEEILKELKRDTISKIDTLDRARVQNLKVIKNYQKRTKQLKNNISNIDSKKAELIKVTKENRLAIAKMQKDKKRYKRSINKLLAQKRSLSNTLARLNIIQKEASKPVPKSKKSSHKSANAKVTKKGSSYTRVKSKKYRGKKTIAPLSSYRLTKKFGPYTDPIYKIKIYNESVTLQPKRSNAKVRTVLNGKVILAKKTQLLDNVVIIKHSNGLHTIYAHLDKIAPTIRKGKKVKKGATIGRVNHELTFEVTQDSYHINPMTLIK